MEKSVGVTLSSGGGIGRSTKKLRCRPKEPLDPDDPIVDAKGMMVNSSGSTNESWKDKLMGNSTDGQETDPAVEEDKSPKQETVLQEEVEAEKYGSWIIFERRQRRKARTVVAKADGIVEANMAKIREIKDVGKEWRHGGEANKGKGKGKGNPKGKWKGPALGFQVSDSQNKMGENFGPNLDDEAESRMGDNIDQELTNLLESEQPSMSM
ncbi:hypothetical protein Golob_001110, partial [Gossypium lobatum]|nr:hypothetical protein [Gossypium lobatum]